MTFIHNDAEWADLLQIVADHVGRDIALVEKDYWVTHTLWALHDQGFTIWFKGGTSLSKGFGLIERFSEDVDVRLDAGSSGLTDPKLSWKNRKKGVTERDAWFDCVAAQAVVPDCKVTRDPAGSDRHQRAAAFEVAYPALHADQLPDAMRPFVLLEVGRARVVPFVERVLSSWVHDFLVEQGQLAEFSNNRPTVVRCIHPWVTALEKVEAIAKRYDKGKTAPDFVRHYEDTARILAGWDTLPPPPKDLPRLLQLLRDEDNKAMPPANHPAFAPSPESERWEEIQAAWEAITPMFWGDRVPLDEATAAIRTFLDGLPTPAD
jgi:hypothetical protein